MQVVHGQAPPAGTQRLRASFQATSDIVGHVGKTEEPPTPAATRGLEAPHGAPPGVKGSHLPNMNLGPAGIGAPPRQVFDRSPEALRILTGVNAAKQRAERKAGAPVEIGVKDGKPTLGDAPVSKDVSASAKAGVAAVRAERVRKETPKQARAQAKADDINARLATIRANREKLHASVDTSDLALLTERRRGRGATFLGKPVASVVDDTVKAAKLGALKNVPAPTPNPDFADVKAAGIRFPHDPDYMDAAPKDRGAFGGHSGRTGSHVAATGPDDGSPTVNTGQTKPDVPEVRGGDLSGEPSRAQYGTRKQRSADDRGHLVLPNGASVGRARSIRTISGIVPTNVSIGKRPEQAHSIPGGVSSFPTSPLLSPEVQTKADSGTEFTVHKVGVNRVAKSRPHRQDAATKAGPPKPGQTRVGSYAKAMATGLRKSSKGDRAGVAAAVARVFGAPASKAAGPKKVAAGELETLRTAGGFKPPKKTLQTLKTSHAERNK